MKKDSIFIDKNCIPLFIDSMKPTIEFKNVKVIYDSEKCAIDIEQLVIGHGENVVIIGPNGSGKSTLINLISRDIYPEPDENSMCRIYGKDRWEVFQLRSYLGIVSPNYQQQFGKKITVMDTVLSGFFSSIGIMNINDVTSTMRKKAAKALDFLEISELSKRQMTELSTGQSRRVLIARALVHNPKTLLLDEPSNGLDIKSAHIFRKYINKIASMGTNIIIVTHSFEDIVPCIKRAVLLRNGKIFLDGKCEDVITSLNISQLYSMKVKIIKSKTGFSAELSENK
jgi:iron complex transport system ATP-binding protein